MMTKNIPAALIIAYRRNKTVYELIEILEKALVPRIYIAIDGAKSEEDLRSQEELASTLHEKRNTSSSELLVWKRDRNLGPAIAVISAIEWFFENEDKGVIFEDDLKIEASTVEYFKYALDAFENDPRIGVISGSNFWGQYNDRDGYPFARYPLTWGWATWKNRWHILREPFFQSTTPDLKRVPWVERTFWRTGCERCLGCNQDAWDIPFAANFRNLQFLAVLPKRNLVTNIGFDQFAGNTLLNQWPLNVAIQGEFNANDELKLSNDKDLTDKIIHEIYKVRSLSLVVRPLRIIQKYLYYRKLNALKLKLELVESPQRPH